MSQRIFISYRREDAAGDAGRLADHLYRRFGKERVFVDVDTIDPGTDFVEVLSESLKQTAAVLVVIGARWTSLLDERGMRRLDSPKDFVRLEVEVSLSRKIPVVPVLVQGARMPKAQDLPASLAPLVNRQAVTLDHHEFHDDAERLCDRLATVIGDRTVVQGPSVVGRWWPAAAVVALVAVGIAGYLATQFKDGERAPNSEPAAEFLAQAVAQRSRNQFVESLATLSKAREAIPQSTAVRDMQEDVAMDWIRNARVESGKGSFGDAIKPALVVIDNALVGATGVRRADLLAHSGWASFLLWRDGDRSLNPATAYGEALQLDPGNPYANAMLAHWILFQGDNVPRAVALFDTALHAGRAVGAVRSLQWSAYGNTSSPEANAARLRVADAMRRDGVKLTARQAQALWGPYYFALAASRVKDRQALLDALPPDDHIRTLGWAFDEYAANDQSRRQTIRYYIALLRMSAGRRDEAAEELRSIKKELKGSSGPLGNAVERTLERL